MGDDVLAPLEDIDAQCALSEFQRSTPSARTRKQTGEEKLLLLTRSGMGRKRDGVPVPLMLLQDTVTLLAWLTGEMGCLLKGNPGATLDQHWRVVVARDRALELQAIVSNYHADEEL